MKKNAIIIFGVAGRMGQELLGLLQKHPRAEYYAGVDYRGRGTVKHIKEIKAPKNSVVVEFSGAKGFSEALAWCSKNRVAFISGSTGLSGSQIKAMKSASKKIPVLWSANMSLGINIFSQIIKSLGTSIKGFDLQIEERHHAKKKDSPSGTALTLQRTVEAEVGRRLPPVLATRGGGIVGTHKLLIMGDDEMLVIEHSALNRAVFARGALEAAIWLANKKPGLYEMSDVLNG